MESEGHEDHREDRPHAKEGQGKPNFYCTEANAETDREAQHRCGEGGQDQGERPGPAERLRTGGHLVPTDQLVEVRVGDVVVVLCVRHHHHPALLRPHLGNGREGTTGQSGLVLFSYGAGTQPLCTTMLCTTISTI